MLAGVLPGLVHPSGDLDFKASVKPNSVLGSSRTQSSLAVVGGMLPLPRRTLSHTTNRRICPTLTITAGAPACRAALNREAPTLQGLPLTTL